MSLLGIALAFMAFGLVAGLGVFTVTSSVPAVIHGFSPNPGLSHYGGSWVRWSLAMVTHLGLLLIGIMLMLAGALATYRVIYL